jgi:hypothetical protein
MSLCMLDFHWKSFHYQHSEIFAVRRTHMDGCQKTTDWGADSWLVD